MGCVSMFRQETFCKSAYRLVHQTKRNLIVALVLRRDLRPKTGELGVGGTTLTHDGTVPTSVIMDINNAECSTRVQAALDLSVVGLPVVGIEGTTKVVVEKELPSNY